MNCPFCGTVLARVAAICPGCKIQLPDANLIPYYISAIERDKSLAITSNRNKLDTLVEREFKIRSELLQEAKRKAAKEESDRIAKLEQKEKEKREKAEEKKQLDRAKRTAYIEANQNKVKALWVIIVISISAMFVFNNIYIKKQNQKEIPGGHSVVVDKNPCSSLGKYMKSFSTLTSNSSQFLEDGSYSKLELSKINNEALRIQKQLFSSTIGIASNYPAIEGVIVEISNSLPTFSEIVAKSNSISDLEKRISLNFANLNLNARKYCEQNGFKTEFEKAISERN